ncbi:MAG: UvrD-helicase domain-containing protein [Bacteroidales bacterium]|nr:UvrD-helicase domain-containing protein [Bacteroidales bacterium]MCI2121478.1 UvrD-helicase domain-containing protein [Bacteroidales bacterium]MCI2145275.1 UvrD-helicase domain-containing protein [Bacteroidales bacterium]
MKEEEKIFQGLNSAQNEAVRHLEGPALIVAGAGSGKTKVLTCRIANILAHGADPSTVMALTFTKKAANEMRERIAALIGEVPTRRLWMGTFHSVFVRFLREYAELIGYPRTFTIYDQSDSRSAVRECIRKLQLDDKTYKPNEMQSRISLAKNSLITPSAYASSKELTQEDMRRKKERTTDLYNLYCKTLKESGAMDFDDLLLNVNILFRDHPEALEKIRSRFRYILVDEYQDTNYAQYLILKKLSAVHRNICVVGDDSQSIYGFRGARISNILNFRKDYPDLQEFRLERNYRSTQTIVDAANSLIEHNTARLKKECFSEGPKGEKISVIKAYTEQEEGFMISKSIHERLFSDNAAYGDFAILYRTNAQSRAIEEALRKDNMPYKIYAGHSFYDRAEVKDMIAYFKLVMNGKDNEAFKRVVNFPARGIGATTLERLSNAAEEYGSSLFDAACMPGEKLAGFGIKQSAVDKIGAFCKFIASKASLAETTDAYALALSIANESGALAALKSDNTLEGISRFENVEELLNSVREFTEDEAELRKESGEDYSEGGAGSGAQVITIGEYLENITLLSDVEKEDDKENADRITLMTVHASKGLEFPYVYVAGLEESLFPSSMAISASEVEEERRLFYVAITRAEKDVTLSFSQSRFKWGQHTSNPPSRFLKEINPKCLDRPELARPTSGYDNFTDDNDGFGDFGFRKRHSGQVRRAPENAHFTHTLETPHFSPKPPANPNFVPDPVSAMSVGRKVEHDRFGEGTIIAMEGDGSNAKAIIDFVVGGKKTLLLKYAKLRVIL